MTIAPNLTTYKWNGGESYHCRDHNRYITPVYVRDGETLTLMCEDCLWEEVGEENVQMAKGDTAPRPEKDEVMTTEEILEECDENEIIPIVHHANEPERIKCYAKRASS